MKRICRWALTGVLLASVLFVGGSWLQAQRLTRARPCTIALPTDFPFPLEAISVTTRDRQSLSGWLVSADDHKKAIVLLHGYTGNRKQMVRRARFFREQGYTALLYDARACGESTGECTTFGYREREDLIAAVKFLKDRGHANVACLGVSQGGATILFAADDLRDVKCVICESVYDEMTHAVDRRMRRYTGIPGWLGASLMVPFAENRLDLSIDDVRPVDYVGKLHCPVFIIGGERDDRTWPEDTRRLFGAARAPKELWLLPEARHEDLFRFPEYQERILTFLNRHVD